MLLQKSVTGVENVLIGQITELFVLDLTIKLLYSIQVRMYLQSDRKSVV